MRRLVYIVFLFLGTLLYGQTDKFRRDYNYVSFYRDGKWGEWEKGRNTIVFNANVSNDIIIYKASGDKEVYRKISKIEKGKNKDGIDYQSVELVDEEGNEPVLVLYDSGTLKFVYDENFQIQFEP